MEQNKKEKIGQLSDTIYNLCCIAEFYCKSKKLNEEIRNIYPLVSILLDKADELNCIFINLDIEIDE